jgi:rare lipoprotein A
VVGGRVYVPRAKPQYDAVGYASWYGSNFYGRYTANGEIFDSHSITAANPTLPLPCYVRVTDLEDGRSLVVRVNDRGPYVGNRIVDVSARAAKLLGFYNRGTARVRVRYLGPAPLAGSSDRLLAATLREGEPAPFYHSLELAREPLFPPAPPPPSTREMLASAATNEPLSDPKPENMSSLDPANSMDDTAQVLNGRGLY